MQHGTDLDGYRRGSLQFAREIHESLGVSVDDRARGYIPTDERGLPQRPRAALRADEYSLRTLAESIMGHEFIEEHYHPSAGFEFGNRALLESAIDPTAFIDISTFNLGVAGLINAKVMERFNAPDYIGRNLVEIVPTNQNGHKRIAVAKISPPGKASKGRQPGEQHTEIGFGEMYQSTPPTVEQALKVAITREAVFFDLTGQVLDSGSEIGDDLAYGQDRDIAGMILGVTSLASRYNFNGTTYETYQATSPWVNSQPNPLVTGTFDVNAVDKSRQLFVGMTDPATGREIKVYGRDLLVAPGSELLAMSQVYSTTIQIGSQINSSFPSWWQTANNELAKVGANLGQSGAYRIIPLTPIWYNILTASATASNGYPGLALSAVNANKRWYHGDFARAFEWQENWPLTPWQAPADELVMKDRGLVAIYGCNYRGSGFVKEPRYAVVNTN
jgi:hypothetical protein